MPGGARVKNTRGIRRGTAQNLGSTAREAAAIVPRVSDEKRSEGELEEKDDTAKGASANDGTGTSAEGDVSVAERTPNDTESADDEDVANPAAIARRVAALGGDDATEALANEEERKLAERRAAKKR